MVAARTWAAGCGLTVLPRPLPRRGAGSLLTGGALRASAGQPFWLLAWRLRGSSRGACWASRPGPGASGRASGVGRPGPERALRGPRG